MLRRITVIALLAAACAGAPASADGASLSFSWNPAPGCDPLACHVEYHLLYVGGPGANSTTVAGQRNSVVFQDRGEAIDVHQDAGPFPGPFCRAATARLAACSASVRADCGDFCQTFPPNVLPLVWSTVLVALGGGDDKATVLLEGAGVDCGAGSDAVTVRRPAYVNPNCESVTHL